MYAESQSSEYSQHLKEKTIFNEHPVYAIYFLQNGIAQPDFHEHARSEGHDREIGFFFFIFSRLPLVQQRSRDSYALPIAAGETKCKSAYTLHTEVDSRLKLFHVIQEIYPSLKYVFFLASEFNKISD